MFANNVIQQLRFVLNAQQLQQIVLVAHKLLILIY